MDVLNVLEELTLRDVEVRHVISVLGYGSNTINIFIFIDKDANTYYWTTSGHPPLKKVKYMI